MKRKAYFGIAFLISISAIIAIGINSKSDDLDQQILPAKTEVRENNPKKVVDFDFEDQELGVAWIEVEAPEQLELHANFEERLTGEEAFEKNKCKSLVSAGFYTKENTPLGLFVSKGIMLEDQKQNNFINGFLTINYFDIPRITFEYPKDLLKIGLQSGPILIENSFDEQLSIINDENARRVVAAVTGENSLVFLIIYGKENVFDGPYLSDLPQVLKVIEEKIKIIFADAINLDGGTASAFYTDDFKLSELSPIGSYFCVK